DQTRRQGARVRKIGDRADVVGPNNQLILRRDVEIRTNEYFVAVPPAADLVDVSGIVSVLTPENGEKSLSLCRMSKWLAGRTVDRPTRRRVLPGEIEIREEERFVSC